MISRTIAGLIIAACLSACGGSGGGDRADGVEPGPNPPSGTVPPPVPPAPQDPTSIHVDDIAAADTITVEITGVTMTSPPTVTFSVSVNGSLDATDLSTSNLRLSLAELVPEENFDIESWEAFIETVEDPVCRNQADIDSADNGCTSFTAETDPALIADSARKVQDAVATGKVQTNHATTENNGSLTDNGDGTWSYTYSTDPGDPAAIANMLRSCIQFSFNAPADNVCIDFVPQDLVNPAVGDAATSLSPGFYDAYRSRKIVSEGTCNSCHSNLAHHGSARRATDYCVTCHNPGTIDANSENSVDFKVMVHRIHNARNLDSVIGGLDYKIFGFRNGSNNFSTTSYPQKVINCTRCHAGQEDVDRAIAAGLPVPEAQVTPDGYNWSTKPNPVTCLSCHEDQQSHVAGRTSCTGCHGPGGFAAVEERHADLVEIHGRGLALTIDDVTSTAEDENPVITFSVKRDGSPVDILDPGAFDGSVGFRIAWDAATEYLNSGGSKPPIIVDAIVDGVAIGGDQFQIDTAFTGVSIPAGIDTIAVNGYLDENIPEGLASGFSPVEYFASTAVSATPRRVVVEIERCNNCHRRFTFHAPGDRSVTDNPQVCVGCHEPNRASGKAGNSTDYSGLIHGLHAGGFRETPYRGYDTTRLQFPGDLSNCGTCHANGTYQLPLPLSRAPVKQDSDAELYDTPIAAACAACHDSDIAAAHMTSTGGAVFRGTFADADAAVEGCEVCHRTGAIADVDVVHAR